MSFLARGSKTLASKLQKSGPASAARVRSITTHSQLSEEQRMLYEMCRRFADEEIAPNAREWDQKHEFPSKVKDLVRCVMYHVSALLVLVKRKKYFSYNRRRGKCNPQICYYFMPKSTF
jgi:hypothetical protein